MSPPRSPYRILVLGGSYAGLAAAVNLTDLCEGKNSRTGIESSRPGSSMSVEITIVDERDGFFHLIGAPLALAEEQYAKRAWKKYAEIPGLQQPSLRFIHGSVSRLDCKIKKATIVPHGSDTSVAQSYDYLIAATGLRRVWPTVPQELTRDRYLVEAVGHINQVRNADKGVVVIGGGAVGVEMAAEIKMVEPHVRVSLIHSRNTLLSSEPLPDKFGHKTLALLEEVGVEVMLGQRVVDISPSPQDQSTKVLRLSNGIELLASHVINAVSRPVSTSTYIPSEALDADGYVKVLPSMQFPEITPNAAYHFAVGDIVAWSGIKRAGGAFYMGGIAASNIHRHILHSQAMIEQPKYIEALVYPPSIAVAVGRKAVGYSEREGVTASEALMEVMFGDDLGLSICWRYLGLGVPWKPLSRRLGMGHIELV
ncbi:uncharacterized protein Z518_08928 [Rhinocladiella mackenziei CBS 650.93]|uniref:FAD/NAD(P)-binding domain-containing protein n=1 Tax=Rhinocladiella mackenziei CBS 650.93 TaxID=1442369 RepID=A0A0D2GS93_9EURO|nr:uncharacterized protein Z518_08928 [Rhinocladiella mackenziei CBS 650.93]KIX01203.1 hypothetical protein Z518_08928 [Rhinocladiella mackenziei CBS 650.93]